MRSIYDCVPLRDTGNSEFLDILDSIPIGNCKEHTDLERQAKIIFIIDNLKFADESDRAIMKLIGNEYIYGYDRVDNENTGVDIICVCQAEKVLFNNRYNDIHFNDTDRENLKFIEESLYEYTKYLKEKTKEYKKPTD
ncbi:hypothetical protein FDB52_12085 [Clostridium botulinum]|nr:hypothetical protein [Clostridium botulinum]NFN49272.1 hypothetical protein [Clostridium botulinum]